MGNSEELDSTAMELVLQARRGDIRKRQDLKAIVKDVIFKGQPGVSSTEIDSLVGYILSQLVTGRYCERNLRYSYEDDNMVYAARSVPALKKGSTRYFMSGDSHFFYRVGEGQYLMGRMDGMGHGVEAGMTVLVARKYMDELVDEGTCDPKLLVENLNERFSCIFGGVEGTRFTTMLVSLLKNRRVLLTNVGGGDAFVYCPSKETFEEVESHGLPIGVLSPHDIELLNQPYTEEERMVLPGFTLVSYTDGINEREDFDRDRIKRVIVGNVGNISLIISQIFEYAGKLSDGADDSTVIGLYIK